MKARKLLLGSVLIGLVGWGGWYGWRWYTTPVPPDIPLDGASKEKAEKIEQAREEVRRHPRSARAWADLGLTLLANGFTEQPIPCFAQAQRLDPKEPRWPYFQGALLLNSNPREAFVKLREALAVARSAPVRKEILFLLAVGLVEDGQLDEAERHLQELRAIDGDSPAVHFGLGLLAVAGDDRPTAVAHLSQLTDHPCARKRACALLALLTGDDRQRALDYRRRAAELPDDRPWPRYFEEEVARYRAVPEQRLTRYLELAAEGHREEALNVLRQFVEQSPDETSCFALGFELFKANQFEEAEPPFRQAVGFNPRNPKAHFFLGTTLLQMGEKRLRQADGGKKALELFREAVAAEDKAIALQNDLADAHLTRARALKHLTRTAEAIEAFRQAVRVGTEYAEMHQALGEALAESGQLREGLEHLENAVNLAKPDDPRPRAALEKWKGKTKPSP